MYLFGPCLEYAWIDLKQSFIHSDSDKLKLKLGNFLFNSDTCRTLHDKERHHVYKQYHVYFMLL